MIRSRQHSSFAEYCRQLLRLHELISCGKGDSDEADAIRDQMDAPWRDLNAAEVRLIDGLSADLYSLGKSTPATTEGQSDAAEIAESMKSQDWTAVLETLRQKEIDESPRYAQFMRGICWSHLGHPHVAIAFFAEAARLRPFQPEEEIWQLMCYAHAGRSQEAVPRAKEIIETSDDPLLVLTAAHVLFDAEFTEDAVKGAEHGLALLERLPADAPLRSDPSLAALQTGALLHLAMSYSESGDEGKDRAIDACNEVLRLSPNNLDALMLLGWLNDKADLPHESNLRDKLERALMNREMYFPAHTLCNPKS